MLEELLDRFRQGDRRALTRLLTLAARGEHLVEIEAALHSRWESRLQPAKAGTPIRVVALTGSPGVGKSTLIGKLIGLIRAQQKTVAVLACDPRSPLTGGALLGDRFRMSDRTGDDGVFIRSLSTPADRGAVPDHLGTLVALLKAFGFDVILIETVGAGQGDVAVREAADVVVLLLQPATGDDLQWEKAGILEVADLVAIHKADLPQADEVQAQVRSTLGLSAGPAVPVVRISSKSGEGLAELWRSITELKPMARTGSA
jgi:LAO/AO transport system ATPase